MNCFESIHLYKNVCRLIDIPLVPNYEKDELPNAVDDFIIDLQNYPECHQLSMYEKILYKFIDCIRKRWIQRDLMTNRLRRCLRRLSNDNLELSELNLLILCREANKIYSIYKSMIYVKNMIIEIENRNFDRKTPLILDIFNKDIFKNDDKIIRQTITSNRH